MLINLPLEFPFIFCHLVPSASSPPPLILSSPRFILYLSRMCALSLSLSRFSDTSSCRVFLSRPYFRSCISPCILIIMVLHSLPSTLHQILLLTLFLILHPSIPPTCIPLFILLSPCSLLPFLSTKSYSFTSHSSPLFQPHQQLLQLNHLCRAVDSLFSPCILIFSCHRYLLHIASVLMFSMHKASDRGFCHRLCTLLKASGSLIHVS